MGRVTSVIRSASGAIASMDVAIREHHSRWSDPGAAAVPFLFWCFGVLVGLLDHSLAHSKLDSSHYRTLHSRVGGGFDLLFRFVGR